jgi:hypothetical protein
MKDTSGVIPGRVNFMKICRSGRSTVKSVTCLSIPDSVSMVLRGMSFAEAGGFTARSIDMNLAVQQSNLNFREIDIITDSSSISAEKILLMPRDTASWRDFVNGVRMDLLFNRSASIHQISHILSVQSMA